MADTKRFLSLEDLTHMPTPRWLIEGLFEVNSLVMLAGPPASYKSFLALDWVLSMACGRKWHGKPTVAAKVLYALGEGKASLLKRIQTWAHYHQITPEEHEKLVANFRVTFDVPQLAVKSSVDNMLSGLEAESFHPDVIVVDTFARSFVGLDENSQQDTGLWIESADRLRQRGFTVIFLHHTAKNTEFGLKYRGSTAIMGAMDTAFTLQRDSKSSTESILSCTKQKDHDEGDDIYLNRVIVRPYPQEEGSIVLIPANRVDERFTVEGQLKEAKTKALIEKLIEDESFTTDTDRARVLAEASDISLSAAKKRIERAKALT